MSSSPDIVKQAIEALPEMEKVEEQLGEPDAFLKQVFPPEDPDVETRAIVQGTDVGAELNLPQADETVRRAAIEHGRNALRKIRTEGFNAQLTPAEQFGAEAIVLMVGRPAILFQDGKFLPPPDAWAVLEQHRDAIQAVAKSVGRIEVDGHPEYEWIGTGWLVADDVVITNRHVAKEFTRQEGTGWTFEPGMTARIDYVEELGAVTASEFALQEVIGIHDTFDLSLFRVERAGGADPPPGLQVKGSEPDAVQGRQVFVIGYPAWDGRRNDPSVMQRIFSNIFDVKRLQPGQISGYLEAESIFTHDCSTLGGNSGSCVVDLEAGQVYGLHFSGRYREANRAVALWRLTADPLLQRAGVNFA